jgi:importin-7
MSTTNVAELKRVLEATFSSNITNEERAAAERRLREIESYKGYLSSLLELIATSNAPPAICTSAALRFKNIVQKWKIATQVKNTISEHDQTTIKKNIVRAIVVTKDHRVRKVLVHAVRSIIKEDFPERWPGLMPELLEHLRQDDKQRVLGALYTLSMLFKKYEYFSADRREMAEKVICATFPIMLKLSESVLEMKSILGFEMLKLIVKNFYRGVHLCLPDHVNNPAVINAWMSVVMRVNKLQMPQDQIPQNARPGVIYTHPMWKARKWAARICMRLFSRWGQPNSVMEEKRAFAHHFYDKMSLPIMENCLHQLREHKVRSISPDVQFLIFGYLDICVNYSRLFKVMKRQLPFLLFEAIMPAMSISEEDIEIFKDDPHEYIRKNLDILLEFEDPKMMATNLLISLVSKRTSSCRDQVLRELDGYMEKYANSPPDQRNYMQKDAALTMLGSLRKLLIDKPEYQAPLERTIMRHVLPEFKSPAPWLQARACWFVGQFNKLEYSSPQAHATAVKPVVAAMKASELPVRLEACFAVSRIVRNENVHPYVKPMVPAIIEQFFMLFDDIGNEDVVTTMTELISAVGVDISVYAESILKRLIGLFRQLVQESRDEQSENEDAALSAYQVTRAINAVLYGIRKTPDLFVMAEELLRPLIINTLTPDGIEYLEMVLEMVTYITMYAREISPFMWSLFERLVNVLFDWGRDFLKEMMPPLDNFISRGNAHFINSSNPNYLQMLVQACIRLLSEEQMLIEGQYACKLLETILYHSKGKVNPAIEPITKAVVQRLLNPNTSRDVHLVFCNLDVLAALCYYNPHMFLGLIHKANVIDKVFAEWISRLGEMQSYKHHRMAVLGLSSLCQIPVNELPPSLKQGFPAVLNNVLEVMGVLCVPNGNEELHDDAKQASLRTVALANDAAEHDSDADDADVDVAYDEDVQAFHDLDENDDFDEMALTDGVQQAIDEMYQYDYHEVDEANFTSPIDDVDEVLYFSDAMRALNGHSHSFHAHWLSELNAEQRNIINVIRSEEQDTKQKLAAGGKN